MSSFVRVRYGFRELFLMWIGVCLGSYIVVAPFHQWEVLFQYSSGALAALFAVWLQGKYSGGPKTAERVDLDE